MASVFKKTGRKKWQLEYVDECGRIRRRTGFTDRQATVQLAHELETRAAKIKSGLIRPDELKRAEAGRLPLGDHLVAWRADMEARGTTREHARKSHRLAGELLTGCATLADVTPGRVQSVLGEMRRRGLAAKTINHALTSCKAFTRWAVREGLLTADPLTGLQPANVAADRRHVRRALSTDEVTRLIEAARNGPDREGMSGADRAMLYTLALTTGIRKGELAQLRPCDCDLTADPARITIPAAFAKARRADTIPIPAWLADQLRQYVAGKPTTEPIFTMPAHPDRMIRADFQAAGIALETPSGKADFHCLRHTFVTTLARQDVPVKVLQQLARHTSPQMTLGVYSHIGVVDMVSSIRHLPDLSPGTPDQADRQPLAATGTDEKNVRENVREFVRINHSPAVNSGQRVPLSAISGSGRKSFEMNTQGAGSQQVSSQGANLAKMEVRGVEPLTGNAESPTESRVSSLSAEAVSVNLSVPDRESTPEQHPTVDPELARLVAAWPELPEHIRQTIKTLIGVNPTER